MPMYSFKCSKCGHTSDKLMSLKNRKDSVKCSKCNSTAIRVTANLFNTHFKGVGRTFK
jgi:putative FmdB family regulatory protein